MESNRGRCCREREGGSRSVGERRHMPDDGGNAERARLNSLSPKPPPSPPFPGICLSPTISSFFSLTPNSIFCVTRLTRGFMLRPFSDSRQLLRFIHPNISYYVSTPLTTRFLQSVSAFKGNGCLALRRRLRRLSWARVVALVRTLLWCNNHAFLFLC